MIKLTYAVHLRDGRGENKLAANWNLYFIFLVKTQSCAKKITPHLSSTVLINLMKEIDSGNVHR